jgi:hypothetical protein
MNDFSEIENELKKLRPMQPSAEFFARVEQAVQPSRASAPPAKRARRQPRRPSRLSYNWWPLGVGLAAAAVLLLLARINMQQRGTTDQNAAQISSATETRPVLPARRGGSEVERSTSADQFIPAGATQVVYNTVDEGLRFVDGSEAPLRRLRYQTHETLQWRNPRTGESLRVSYPSEEIVLLPVSGQ